MSKNAEIDVVCNYCGKEYRICKSAYDRRKRHFCSRKCYSNYRSDVLSISEQNAFRGNSIPCNCDYCGKEYYIYKSNYAQSKRHFCSQECYQKYRSEKLPHEEQNAYGRGHTPEERKLRKKVRIIWNHYRRDKKIKNQPCEICGCDKSEAHHDDYSKPLEVRWLCRKCHRHLHTMDEKLSGILNERKINSEQSNPNGQTYT